MSCLHQLMTEPEDGGVMCVYVCPKENNKQNNKSNN